MAKEKDSRRDGIPRCTRTRPDGRQETLPPGYSKARNADGSDAEDCWIRPDGVAHPDQ